MWIQLFFKSCFGHGHIQPGTGESSQNASVFSYDYGYVDRSNDAIGPANNILFQWIFLYFRPPFIKSYLAG